MLGGAGAIGGGPALGAARIPASVSYPDLVAVLMPDVAPVAPAAKDLAVLGAKGLRAMCGAGQGSPQGLSNGMAPICCAGRHGCTSSSSRSVASRMPICFS